MFQANLSRTRYRWTRHVTLNSSNLQICTISPIVLGNETTENEQDAYCNINYSYPWILHITCKYTQRNIFEILLNTPENRFYLPFSDWFVTKCTFVWFQINRKMVNTIWFLLDLIRFRKYFFVWTYYIYVHGTCMIHEINVHTWNLNIDFLYFK